MVVLSKLQNLGYSKLSVLDIYNTAKKLIKKLNTEDVNLPVTLRVSQRNSFIALYRIANEHQDVIVFNYDLVKNKYYFETELIYCLHSPLLSSIVIQNRKYTDMYIRSFSLLNTECKRCAWNIALLWEDYNTIYQLPWENYISQSTVKYIKSEKIKKLFLSQKK